MIMAFIIKGKDASENNKQHLNLSPLAYNVIKNDLFTFGEEKLSGFIKIDREWAENTLFRYKRKGK